MKYLRIYEEYEVSWLYQRLYQYLSLDDIKDIIHLYFDYALIKVSFNIGINLKPNQEVQKWSYDYIIEEDGFKRTDGGGTNIEGVLNSTHLESVVLFIKLFISCDDKGVDMVGFDDRMGDQIENLPFDFKYSRIPYQKGSMLYESISFYKTFNKEELETFIKNTIGG